MARSLVCLLLSITMVRCDLPQTDTPPAWRLIYQNDFNGRATYGNVGELVAAMKSGAPIRVAWGGQEEDGSTWIEFAEPDFTTIMNDSAVLVQFPLSVIQTHYTDPAKSFLNIEQPAGWRALMGTTGRYHQFHYDFTTHELVRTMYCRTTVSWFVQQTSRPHSDPPTLTPAHAFIVDSVRYPPAGR